jgi:hypothetical protein
MDLDSQGNTPDNANRPDSPRSAYSAEVSAHQPDVPSVLGCMCTTHALNKCHAAILQSRGRLLVVDADSGKIAGALDGKSLHVWSRKPCVIEV